MVEYSNEEILQQFFEINTFHILPEGVQLELVPERLRGETLDFDLADGDKVATLAQEKLAALTTLLKERVAVLKRELQTVELQAIHTFNLPPYSPFSEASLKRHLVEHQQELQADIAMMQRDLQQAGDDAYFKRWLQEQHRLRQDEAEFDPLEFF